ncbi:MAG: hypothetical protein VX667_03030 [Nitrospinota bacterium]|nr:hypothetical protein [Nitrospinota bacterium]
MDPAKKEELDKKWKTIATQTVTDEDFKMKLVNDPIGVLKEHGLNIPEGAKHKVGTGKIHKLIIPNDAPEKLKKEVKWFMWRLDMIREFGKDDRTKGNLVIMNPQEIGSG